MLSNRLKSFDEFVKDEAAKQAQKAAAEVENQHLAFKGITCARPDLESRQTKRWSFPNTACEIYAGAPLSAARRRRYILDASDQSDWTTLPPLSESPAGILMRSQRRPMLRPRQLKRHQGTRNGTRRSVNWQNCPLANGSRRTERSSQAKSRNSSSLASCVSWQKQPPAQRK